MNPLQTVISWAGKAWGAITGAGSAVGGALTSIFRYVTGVHNLLAWLTSNPLIEDAKQVFLTLNIFHLELVAIRDVLRRLDAWIFGHRIMPQVKRLLALIAALRAWTVRQLWALTLYVIRLYLAALAYTDRLVGAERAQRVQADKAEHAAMLQAVKAALATVQQEAASGYNTGLHGRVNRIEGLLDDIVTRTPAVKVLVRDLIGGVIDLESVENPVARIVLGRVLQLVIDRVGVDRITADLVSALLGPLAGQPRARGLYDVCKDVSDRLDALEAQQAAFMDAGGPEVEQAGREWKELTGVAADVALLGWVGLAVTNPQAWAASAADTIGVAGDGAMTAIVSLIGA